MVKNNNHPPWVEIALAQTTREIAGWPLGDSLPAVYRQGAVGYTDWLDSYRGILPKQCHRPVKNNSGQMDWVEQF